MATFPFNVSRQFQGIYPPPSHVISRPDVCLNQINLVFPPYLVADVSLQFDSRYSQLARWLIAQGD